MKELIAPQPRGSAEISFDGMAPSLIRSTLRIMPRYHDVSSSEPNKNAFMLCRNLLRFISFVGCEGEAGTTHICCGYGMLGKHAIVAKISSPRATTPRLALT